MVDLTNPVERAHAVFRMRTALMMQALCRDLILPCFDLVEFVREELGMSETERDEIFLAAMEEQATPIPLYRYPRETVSQHNILAPVLAASREGSRSPSPTLTNQTSQFSALNSRLERASTSSSSSLTSPPRSTSSNNNYIADYHHNNNDNNNQRNQILSVSHSIRNTIPSATSTAAPNLTSQFGVSSSTSTSVSARANDKSKLEQWMPKSPDLEPEQALVVRPPRFALKGASPSPSPPPSSFSQIKNVLSVSSSPSGKPPLSNPQPSPSAPSSFQTTTTTTPPSNINTNNTAQKKNSEKDSPSKETNSSLLRVTRAIRVPASSVSKIIGKDGTNIARIRARTHAIIKIFDQFVVPETTIVVTGTPAEVDLAETLLNEAKDLKESNVNPTSNATTSSSVSSRAASRVSPSSSFVVPVPVPSPPPPSVPTSVPTPPQRSPSTPPPPPPPTFPVSSSWRPSSETSQSNTALSMTSSSRPNLAFQALQTPRTLQSPRAPQPASSSSKSQLAMLPHSAATTLRVVQVPTKILGCLIGGRGSRISQLRRDTNTEIEISDDRGALTTKITIIGCLRDVTNAETVILRRLASKQKEQVQLESEQDYPSKGWASLVEDFHRNDSSNKFSSLSTTSSIGGVRPSTTPPSSEEEKDDMAALAIDTVKHLDLDNTESPGSKGWNHLDSHQPRSTSNATTPSHEVFSFSSNTFTTQSKPSRSGRRESA